MPDDPRDAVYQDLHQRQLSRQEQTTAHSAKVILALLGEFLQPASLLDVGCGLGSWLRVARESGFGDVMGIEGPWLDLKSLVVEAKYVRTVDLEKPFDLGRRFDLAVCLEVGEHLAASAAPHLVESLVKHADCVLFSAAIPFQGGHHHVNEQFLPYWVTLFASHGYVPLDVIRAKIWEDRSIHWWLRQNVVLFVRQSVVDASPKLAAERGVERPISIVHPDVYHMHLSRALKRAEDFQKVFAVLSKGGTFEVKNEAGNLMIRQVK